MPRKKKSKVKIADPGPTLTTGKNGTIYLDAATSTNATSTTPYFAKWDDTKRFDPKTVNWDDLLTLYQDDPLLAAVFQQMKEYAQGGGKFQDYKYQWTINSPGAVSSSTSNVGLANSFTLVYDSAGNSTIIEDK